MVVSEEVKGRALGTYDLLMGVVSMIAQFVGASIWDISGSLRMVYGVAGVIALVTSIFVFILLRFIQIPENNKAIASMNI